MCKEACPDVALRERYRDGAYVMHHPYVASVHSAAGNCWCGRYELHALHDQER